MPTPKGKRGFAAMDPELRREICSLGGLAAQKKGTAHRWTAAEAQIAGRKGGKVPRKPKAVKYGI